MPSLPRLDPSYRSNHVYENTRWFALSGHHTSLPQCAASQALLSEHIGGAHVWLIHVIMEPMTYKNDEEISRGLGSKNTSLSATGLSMR